MPAAAMKATIPRYPRTDHVLLGAGAAAGERPIKRILAEAKWNKAAIKAPVIVEEGGVFEPFSSLADVAGPFEQGLEGGGKGRIAAIDGILGIA